MKRLLPIALVSLGLLAGCGGAPPDRSASTPDERAAAATRTALGNVTTPISVQGLKKTVSITSWTARANNSDWSCSADDEFRLPECKRVG